MATENDLVDLPIQQQWVNSAIQAFAPESDVVAAVLVGSLASGKGDRVSDADVLVFTQHGFHRRSGPCYQRFETDKDIFYQLAGEHQGNACFKKYIFGDLTSAEIHCVDLTEPFELSQPCKILFDKTGIVLTKMSDKPAPSHENFPVYTQGDDGLIWELFDCIKWLSRGNTALAKDYLKKLSEQF
ncbi:nucleotidyltransferase domain-containing protein [Photobacterium sp. GJ3]|uniref:nucleotidyltransferase domain-containing protein n=1 Tax=Photobacterium sp. GJ3 TaxID=2829502 RepID=UPI001B8AC708|nr:nucleotidyltransferase domain-containing protein [Photobacterium sp. GJ3]QUJ68674.1 nucleotidyltransferase domain-containing protein [Photobacterium sp. GJ3]